MTRLTCVRSGTLINLSDLHDRNHRFGHLRRDLSQKAPLTVDLFWLDIDHLVRIPNGSPFGDGSFGQAKDSDYWCHIPLALGSFQLVREVGGAGQSNYCVGP